MVPEAEKCECKELAVYSLTEPSPRIMKIIDFLKNICYNYYVIRNGEYGVKVAQQIVALLV